MYPTRIIYHYDREKRRVISFIEGGMLTSETFVKWQDAILLTFKPELKKVILRKNGWNVDVPITSHYRQGRKRGKRKPKYRKKHLTGNAYYAAKAGKEMKKKNLYYQGMGAKGGRPRIYNVV